MSISEEELKAEECRYRENKYGLVYRLIQEVRELRGALFAQDERERKAAERLGMIHTCDWPDDVADRVQAAERREKDLEAKIDKYLSDGANTLRLLNKTAYNLDQSERREKVALRALGNVVSFVNGSTGEHADMEEALEQAGKEMGK